MGRSEEQNTISRTIMQERIEKEAVLFFAKKGLAGTKISDLAKHIGISQGLMYRYYASKEELFRTIITKWNNKKDSIYEELVLAPISAKEKIQMVTKNVEELIKKDYFFASIFTIMENEALKQGITTEFKVWSNPPISALGNIIAKGQEEGSIFQGDPIKMSMTYWGLVSAMCRDYLSSGDADCYDYNLLNHLLIKEA